jgi:hypothetical protein
LIIEPKKVYIYTPKAPPRILAINACGFSTSKYKADMSPNPNFTMDKKKIVKISVQYSSGYIEKKS